MELNINQLVRSGVALVIGLPLTLAVLGNVPEKKEPTIADNLKAELELPCLKYAFTGVDSKAERDSKDAIDEVMGTEVNHAEVCKWALG